MQEADVQSDTKTHTRDDCRAKSGRREGDAEVWMLRNLRERTDGHKSGGPKHHGCRFGGSHAKFETTSAWKR